MQNDAALMQWACRRSGGGQEDSVPVNTFKEGEIKQLREMLKQSSKSIPLWDTAGGVALHSIPLTDSLLHVNIVESSVILNSAPESLGCM